jgi:hypothetical protein
MGSTGNATGPCDHFEIRVNGNRTDPIAWMNAHGAGALLGTQRQVVSTASANGRAEPSSKSALAGEPLAPNTVGNFTGWIHGESVEGNDVWFLGTSGRWFWSGGFVGGPNTAGLADMNPQTPTIGPTQRQVVATASSNGRAQPTSQAALVGDPLAPNTVANFDGWARGEKVEGNDTWFHGAFSDRWFWSGGYTDHGIHDLADMNSVTPEPPDPEPANPLNPLGLKSYTPVYPRAIIGLEAPLGFTDCQNPVERASRKVKGSGSSAVPTSGVIDRFIVHWAWPPGDDTRYFSECNSGDSCPTIYLYTDATAREFIRPGAKPASTGKDWNWRSIAWEIEPINDGTNPNVPPITDAQIEELIEGIVWLAECNDVGQVDGAPVSFTIDAEHVITDRETRQTECPGDYLHGKMPYIIDEALRRYEERNPQTPPAGQVLVPRTTLEAWRKAAETFATDVTTLLGE